MTAEKNTASHPATGVHEPRYALPNAHTPNANQITHIGEADVRNINKNIMGRRSCSICYATWSPESSNCG
jgi:hypothetical protein